MKVVIDTNVILVCVSKHSLRHPIFNALIENKISLCVTTGILLEYEEIFLRKFDKEIATHFMDLLSDLPTLSCIDVYYKWKLLNSDVDDNKFVDCAIASQADLIITDDKDFNPLITFSFPKVEIITSLNFIEKYL